MITRNGCGLHVLYTANPSRPPSWVFEGGDANLLLLTGRPHRSNYDPVAAPNDPEALFAIMSVEVSPRWPCAAVLLLLVAAVSCSVSIDDADNVLPVDGFGNEEIKESNLISKCYDEETKTAYKVDSIWYPKGKCEKRTCSRKYDSKTPIIKTEECEPCNNCNLPNYMCQPFKPEKSYPKCCVKCLSKSAILKKTDKTKKYIKN